MTGFHWQGPGVPDGWVLHFHGAHQCCPCALAPEFELLFLLLALRFPIPHSAALHPSSWPALLPGQFLPSES